MITLEQISDLFEQAIQIKDESEQTLFIQRSCPAADDQKRLFGLVQAHSQQCKIVDQPDSVREIACAIEPMHLNEANCVEGSVIGNYRLLQKIGEGGMGQVFMADQLEPIQRLVAVKIIKADLSSRHILARFEAEREALSRLDHPNITRIIDAGVAENGLPYFVMELVKGDSLIDYCDRNKLTVEQRIELLEKVCLAVHHAHQNGILHRDIKPTNIMVAMHDGVAVPKVIDFGIAKALDRPLAQQTLFTRCGDMVGTPQYMSPEQAERRNLDIDARTDIYSLGVVLYELLTGTTPIDAEALAGKGILGVLETVRDCDTESPSLRVARAESIDQGWAHSRNTNPGLLKRILRGELDWITMKALSKDCDQRYDSAAAMAKDLRYYLQNEPVSAVAPTFRYLARKTFQRHRAFWLTLASAVILLIVTSLVSLSWAISNARLAADIKEKSEQLEQLSHDYKQVKDQAVAAESKALELAKQKAKTHLLTGKIANRTGADVASEKDPAILKFAMDINSSDTLRPQNRDRSGPVVENRIHISGADSQQDKIFKTPEVFHYQNPEDQTEYTGLIVIEYRDEFGEAEANYPGNDAINVRLIIIKE